MGNNFYQTNNEILKMDILKPLSDDMKKELFKNNDTLDFYFNHWISRKENLQRCKNEYERGLFNLSYSVIETDFNISNKKARNLVKRFIDNGIVECIKLGRAKGDKSVYAYTSVYYSEEEIEIKEDKKDKVKGIVKDIVKRVNINGFNDDKGIVEGIVKGNSKKEKEKENIKSCRSNSSLASTKKPSLDNQGIKGKTTVKCLYRGMSVKAHRFDRIGNKYRNANNEYIEHNNYIYEIFESEVKRVDNYWRINQDTVLINNFSDNDNKIVYKSKLPFKEIKEDVKKADDIYSKFKGEWL